MRVGYTSRCSVESRIFDLHIRQNWKTTHFVQPSLERALMETLET